MYSKVFLTDNADSYTQTDGVLQEIWGFAGADTIFGGNMGLVSDGMDIIYGNWGNDLIYSDESAIIYGGQNGGLIQTHNDLGTGRLAYREGVETLYGGTYSDVIYGNMGDDLMYGNGNPDTLYGGQDDDTLYGGSNIDRLHGNQGNDLLWGGYEGSDGRFEGSEASNFVNYYDGGPGDDTIVGSFAYDSWTKYPTKNYQTTGETHATIMQDVPDIALLGWGNDTLEKFLPAGMTVTFTTNNYKASGSGWINNQAGVTSFEGKDSFQIPSGLTYTMEQTSTDLTINLSNGSSATIDFTKLAPNIFDWSFHSMSGTPDVTAFDYI